MQRSLQLTLAMLKPDLLLRPEAAEAVRSIIIKEGFHIVRSKVMQWSLDDAMKFYKEHQGKFFFHRLVTYITSGPINPMILAHPSAVTRWRELMGPTRTYQAQVLAPYSIRGLYGLTDTRNSTHGSDSEESARREITFFFEDFDPETWLKTGDLLYKEDLSQFTGKPGHLRS
ncbi:hypothetical protein EMCRGX_G034279 [Ephydatia muelleri]|eukprot:Em0023g199a